MAAHGHARPDRELAARRLRSGRVVVRYQVAGTRRCYAILTDPAYSDGASREIAAAIGHWLAVPALEADEAQVRPPVE